MAAFRQRTQSLEDRLWAQSRRTAPGPIAAVRLNADCDHFNEARRRYFAKLEKQLTKDPLTHVLYSFQL